MPRSPLDPFYGITEADIDRMTDAQVEHLLARASAYSHENAALIDLAWRQVTDGNEVLDLSTPDGARRFNAYLDEGAWDMSNPVDREAFFDWCNEHGVDPNSVPSFEVVRDGDFAFADPTAAMTDDALLRAWERDQR